MDELYNSYSSYLKKKYGERIQKISVNGNFSCPNRDGTVGTTGCSYCNNESFSPALALGDISVGDQIEIGIERLKKRYKVRKFIAYFQSYSNTYAPLKRLKTLYQQALEHPDVIGLSIGTRADCIDAEKLAYLAELNRDYDITIEYGIESVLDDSLKRIGRGHDYRCTVETLKLTQEYGIDSCGHIILGFPWESREHLVHTAKVLAKLPLKFLKIHQLHIVKGSVMGDNYQQDPDKFSLMSQEQYIELLIEFLEYLHPDMIIQRLFGEAPAELLLSPSWGETVSELTNILSKQMKNRDTYQGKRFKEN